MCLDTVTRRYKKPSAKVVKAWKVFTVGVEGRPTFPYYSLAGRWLPAIERAVPHGKWLKAVGGATGLYGGIYTLGFHCFRTQKAAKTFVNQRSLRQWVVLPVKLKYVTARGLQGDLPAIVARQMYVPKPRTQKEKP